MLKVRYVSKEDNTFWFKLDKHLTKEEYNKKVDEKRGYVLLKEDIPIGILRYNLFWDNIPFCTLIYIDLKYQNNGYGKYLMESWERDMKSLGYGMIMTSTQVDENAQHFYRKLNYQDAGGLIINIPEYKQPMEMFFIKAI